MTPFDPPSMKVPIADSLVSVCGTLSLLCTVTVAPGATVKFAART